MSCVSMQTAMPKLRRFVEAGVPEFYGTEWEVLKDGRGFVGRLIVTLGVSSQECEIEDVAASYKCMTVSADPPEIQG